MRRGTLDEDGRRRRWWVAAVVALSSFAVIGVGAAQLRYEQTPGALGTPVNEWPEGSAIARASGRATLLMFVHPRCSCTRASLDELEALSASRPGAAEIILVVDDDDDDPSAPALPLELAGARVVHEHGEETARFGVATSGEVMLFAADGHRRFVGGITPARGVRGPNPGRAALEAALAPSGVQGGDAQVFGCPLTESVP